MLKRAFLTIAIIISGLLTLNALLTAYGATTAASTHAAALAGRTEYLKGVATTQFTLSAVLLLVTIGLVVLRLRLKPVTDVPR
jgi:hypothetical protein